MVLLLLLLLGVFLRRFRCFTVLLLLLLYVVVAAAAAAWCLLEKILLLHCVVVAAAVALYLPEILLLHCIVAAVLQCLLWTFPCHCKKKRNNVYQSVYIIVNCIAVVGSLRCHFAANHGRPTQRNTTHDTVTVSTNCLHHEHFNF